MWSVLFAVAFNLKKIVDCFKRTNCWQRYHSRRKAAKAGKMLPTDPDAVVVSAPEPAVLAASTAGMRNARKAEPTAAVNTPASPTVAVANPLNEGLGRAPGAHGGYGG